MLAVLLFKIFSYAIVLFPVSLDLGQGVVPWLMGHGKILYLDIIEHRPPLTAFMVAAAQSLLNGDTILAVRLLHLSVILISIVVLHIFTFRLTRSELAACIAVVYFAGLESAFDNVLLYFEVVVGLIYLLVVTSLFDAQKVKVRSVVMAGLLMGSLTQT